MELTNLTCAQSLKDRLKAKWESLRDKNKLAYFRLYKAPHWSRFIGTPALRGLLAILAYP